MAEKKIKILLWGLIFGFLAVFTPTCFAKEVGSNKICPVKLNSISVDTTSGQTQLRFEVEIKEPPNSVPTLDIKKSVQKSLEYFFLGLVLPDEKFWVNLNPQKQNSIIDSDLADTDLGKVLLAADLRLKKDVSKFTEPRTSKIGREYWERLYTKAEKLAVFDKIPVYCKVWIVPDEVIVYETEKQITILESKLKVCLESEYFKKNLDIKDERLRQLQDYSEKLMVELILPILNKEVNESPSYEDLRQIYNALILARWYKSKFASQQKSLLQNAVHSVFQDVERDLIYGKDDVYKDYIVSLKNGEYSFVDNNSRKLGFYLQVITRQYFSGGVDFRKTKITSTKITLTNPFNNAVEQSDKRSTFTFSLNIPEGYERPLQYAKNKLEIRAIGPVNNFYNILSILSDLVRVLPPSQSVKTNLPDGRVYKIFSSNI